MNVGRIDLMKKILNWTLDDEDGKLISDEWSWRIIASSQLFYDIIFYIYKSNQDLLELSTL